MIARLALLLMLAGCAPAEHRATSSAAESYATDSGVVFNLTPQELAHLSAKGLAGDAVSAERVATYYGISTSNAAETKRWMKIAADNGSDSSALHYAISYVAPENCEKARGIIADLATNGSPEHIRRSAREWLEDPSLCARPLPR